MKKILFHLLFLSCISMSTFAQGMMDIAKSAAPVAAAQLPAGIGPVLTELGQNIKPEALVSAFKPATWAKAVSALKPADIPGASKLLGDLGSALKPASLVKGFNVADWKSKLKTVTSVPALAGATEQLVKKI